MSTKNPIAPRSRLDKISDLVNQLSNVIIAIGLILFGPFAVIAFAHSFPNIDPTSSPMSWLYLTCGIWTFFMMAFVLGYLGPYLAICGGMALFTVVAISSPNVTWGKRSMLALVALVTGIFIFAPYQPAVSAVDGREMIVPTAPSIPFRGLKRAQAIGEITPCEYEVLGWHETQLYYTGRCTTGKQTWSIPVNLAAAKPRLVDKSLPALSGEQVPHTEILDLFRADAVYPASVEYSVRSLYLQGAAVTSPDGEWTAIVARHLYGAEDVLVVRTPQINQAFDYD